MSASTLCRTATHQSELLVIDDQIAVGCTCGWTCSCGLSDAVTAYGMFTSHAQAAL